MGKKGLEHKRNVSLLLLQRILMMVNLDRITKGSRWNMKLWWNKYENKKRIKAQVGMPADQSMAPEEM